MMYIGVDGCRVGWFVVKLIEGSKWEVNIFRDIRNLWNNCKDASLILIDIPIGLIEEGKNERSCDKEARKLLGRKRGASVFPVPCRDAVYTGIEHASEINKKLTDRKLSKQVLAIIPKIKQVDQLLTSNNIAKLRIREVHPELCFWSLNNKNPMIHRKKDRHGVQERKKLLFSHYPQCELIYRYVLNTYSRKNVARDDILDAMVTAVTASKGVKLLKSLPKTSEFDSKALRMEMVY